MNKLFLIAMVFCVFQASASITCTTTVTGTTLCSGVDKSGRAVNSESYTTGTGTTYIKGTGSKEGVSKCYKNATGTTYCE